MKLILSLGQLNQAYKMEKDIDLYQNFIVNYTSSTRSINFQTQPLNRMLPRNQLIMELWYKTCSTCSFIEFLYQLIVNYKYPSQANSVSIPFWAYNASFCYNLRKTCPFITTITLKFCKITDRGLQIIKKVDWKFIKRANFTGNLISYEGASTISQCNWKYISTMILNQNQIKNRGFRYILQANWKYLTVLQMQYNEFTTDIWKMLAKHNWNYLQTLAIFQEKLKKQMVRSSLQILPKLQMRRLKRIFLDNPGFYSNSPFDIISTHKYYVNNTAKLKKIVGRYMLVIDINRDGNEALEMIQDSRLVTFRFI